MDVENWFQQPIPPTNLNWNASEELKILKMLAWVVKTHEHAGEAKLWARVEELCPEIFEIVMGEGVSLKDICDQTLEEQGLQITPNKLLQRADKAELYTEFNQFKEAVVEAYHREATPIVSWHTDPSLSKTATVEKQNISHPRTRSTPTMAAC